MNYCDKQKIYIYEEVVRIFSSWAARTGDIVENFVIR